MDAIKTKVVPVFYDKHKNILFFSELKSFNSDNFKFLKRTNISMNVPKMYTHYIDFNDVSRHSQNTNLLELIKNIEREVQSKKIKYGIPLIADENNSSIRKASFDEQMQELLNAKKYQEKNNKIISCRVTATLLRFNVGHGLSIFDKTNRILYDCGSITIDWPSYKDKLLAETGKGKKPFRIVISHGHTDHLNFLDDILNDSDFNVTRVFVPFRTLFFKNYEEHYEKFRRFSNAITSIGPWEVFERYHIKGKLTSSQNLDSLVLFNGTQLLTGDQTYFGISIPFKHPYSWNKSNIEEIDLPHHGRGTSGSPLQLGASAAIAFFSDKKNSVSNADATYYTCVKKAND